MFSKAINVFYFEPWIYGQKVSLNCQVQNNRLQCVQRPVLTDILLCYFLNTTELPVIQSQESQVLI